MPEFLPLCNLEEGSAISWKCQGSWGDRLRSPLESQCFDPQAVLENAGWLSFLAGFQDLQPPPRVPPLEKLCSLPCPCCDPLQGAPCTPSSPSHWQCSQSKVQTYLFRDIPRTFELTQNNDGYFTSYDLYLYSQISGPPKLFGHRSTVGFIKL